MKKRLLLILIVLITWLPVFVIQKPVFMFYQHALSEVCTFTDFLQVVLHGLRLDCTIAGYLTAIPLLLTLVSVWLPGAWLKKVLRGYFLIIGILVSAIFSVDVALYNLWGFRLDATLFFHLQSSTDTMASIPLGMLFIQLLVFMACTLSTYAWFTFIPRFAPVGPSFPPTGLEQLGSTSAILSAGGILSISIRGDVATSMANASMVYFSQNQFLNHPVISPCFSLITSLSKQQDFASQFDFYPEEKQEALLDTLIQAQDSLCPGDSVPTEPAKPLTATRPSTLIIIMESFTADAIGAVGSKPGITPNLNRLSKEGVLFTNLYANSFRIDRGLVSVLNGYLARPTTSITKYPVKSQTLPPIAKSPNREGYAADMLYGGDINFTNMQNYFHSFGYDKITADRDFPLNSRLGKWGANDDITFSRLYEDIRQRPVDGKPWLGTFLILSSHESFEVPSHHLEHPYLSSVALADSCTSSFIDTFEELPTWKNTVVVFVSSHGYHYLEDMQEYGPSRFHIPMLWLGGAIAEPRVIDTYVNQTGLTATLLNQMSLPTDEFSFSRDILNPCVPYYVFCTFSDGFGFIDESGASIYDNKGNRILVEGPESGDETRLGKGRVLLQTLYDDLGNR